MFIQEKYQKLIDKLKTKSLETLWEKTEDKTSKDAASILFETARTFAEIKDEITGEKSDIFNELVDFKQNKKKYVKETDDEYTIECNFNSDDPVQTTFSIKKVWLDNTFEELCSYALMTIEETRSEYKHKRQVCEDKVKEYQQKIEKNDRKLFEISNLENAIRTETGGPRDIILANRYASDVRLRMCGTNTKWKFVVPPSDAQFIQLSYTGDITNPTYTSIDPPGGPYLTVGKNSIRPYLMKDNIEINIKSITFKDGSYYLETDPIPEFKVESV